jgi:hypothetical protein
MKTDRYLLSYLAQFFLEWGIRVFEANLQRKSKHTYRDADKSLARPEGKQATSMSKSSWMMDPSRSREMPSRSAIDLVEIRRSSKIISWILSTFSSKIVLFFR